MTGSPPRPLKRRVAKALGQRSGAGRRLVCGVCRHPITHPDAALQVAGRHAHRLTNPAGIRFHVGCFRRAPGCAALGAPTDAHSWFPGCHWRFAICYGCGEHLGWCYSGARRFFGLILDRLCDEPERE